MIRLTVFTPTYNRKLLLQRCYDSLKRQTNKQFIWLIVDDGSTDGTGEVVDSWMKDESDFQIQYVYKDNGGLHTAYNEAIKRINTELCVCIDSDDFMPCSAVEDILAFWELNGGEEYAGIVGLDYTLDDQVIGDPLPNQKSVNLIDLFVGKYNIKNGDRTNVVRTKLYKEVAPMKVYEGEKNFNPHYMNLQISKQYDFLVLNKNLRYVEYQPGGMSDTMLRQYFSSPRSFADTRRLYLSFDNTPFVFRARHTIHLISSCILYGNWLDSFKYSKHKTLTAVLLPVGYVLAQFIKRNCKNR